jgi:L-lactate dehydrogenase complex protein LldF
MSDFRQSFLSRAEKAAMDITGYQIMAEAVSLYKYRQKQSCSYYANLELARNRALYARSKAVSDIETYIKDFECNISKSNVKVKWAMDEKDAVSIILDILNKHDAKKILTSRSATLNEIYLKEQLPQDIECYEISLQEYINQVTEDETLDLWRTSHKDLANILSETFQTTIEPHSKEIIHFLTGKMRNYFFDADTVITGANFLISDVGGIALSENEGDICRAAAFAKTHIIVAGFDKIIPSINDIETLWTLFASSGDGTLMTTYNNLIFGPRTSYENDGAENMYVIILNNGRDAVLRQKEQQKALHCIHCGACKRHCPAWNTIGEKTYQSPYTGPIGSILMPLMKDMRSHRHLLYVSTLNKKPAQHCPVKTPLHDLILHNRALFIKKKLDGNFSLWNIFVKHNAFFLGNRKTMNLLGSRQKNVFLSFLLKKQWGKKRSLPKFAKKSFNEKYRLKHTVSDV